jgi:esterase/lipase superfamily enzyme
MGNRAILRAINRMTTEAATRNSVRFSQIILAAPDLDTDLFHQLCGAFKASSKRTTLYVSSRDQAVGASSWMHSFPRVGLTPPICVAQGIDTINVENVDMTMLGHGYIAEARDVLQDIHSLFAHNTPPERRFGLREAVNEDGNTYWIVGA